jgi:serine/threonine protein kinase
MTDEEISRFDERLRKDQLKKRLQDLCVRRGAHDGSAARRQGPAEHVAGGFDQPDAPTPLAPAIVLGGRWALYDVVSGSDGAGTVWRARDVTGDSRWYVVKVVPVSTLLGPDRTDDLRRRRAVRNEMRLRVFGDHVGEIVDSGEDRDLLYLVSPRYEPGSLRRYCRAMPGRTLRWCLDVGGQILTGLEQGGEVGLVHMDVKPDTVVLDGPDRIRVIDWGLSRVWHDPDRTAVARGTPFYAGPEQLFRDTPGWESPLIDLFGAAAVLYWLIAGEAPLRQDVREEDPDLHVTARLMRAGVRPQRLDELVPGVPAELASLVDRWLAYDPAARVAEGVAAGQAVRSARRELAELAERAPVLRVGAVSGRRRNGSDGLAS